ncbi:N-acetyltransferase [Hymenobacter pini]|uniref:N-acetyltransferase n=1 Tax=Hymenobacter pini TaxID=2880879 RepID=UPI001CF4A87D|nr:N-acetyltransferase [Hymenobacter pini]MCA8833421.1 acetyltransferase [Hymenobacter pini]
MKFNGKNISIGSNVSIGDNVKIGDNCTIYDNVVIGDGCIIANDCIIGEPANAYYRDANYIQKPTIIGANSLLRSHTILYAGSSFGENFVTGHRVTIREESVFGRDCQVGTLSDIQGHVQFGDYCKLHSNVHICEHATIGNHVFIYPYTVFTNDAKPPSNSLKGPTVGDYSIITVHCVLLPGVTIGSNCLVGANSVVGKDLPDFSFAAGTPAKILKDVRELGGHYPWMYSFDRNMPWQGIGFDQWNNSQD